ncbi:MAG TPA: DUF4264 family protein [Selenomonadales bacterium]|nr:DUF4264 family protein [Selenomonadales bacterium]
MEQEPASPRGQLDMLAGKSFPAYNGLVDVVDFLNKSLKKDGYIFGVSKSGEKMTIVIYQTDKPSE